MRKVLIAIVTLLALIGSVAWWWTSRDVPLRAIGTAHLSPQEADVIEAVLRFHGSLPSERINFLTCTPMAEWGRGGGWKRLPDSFHRKIAEIVPGYLPADGAYMIQDGVFQIGSHREAWMEWIHIKRWISDSEVEIEDGMWRCNEGGGAISAIFKKADGKWEFAQSTGGWAS